MYLNVAYPSAFINNKITNNEKIMFFSIINNLLMNEFANSTHKPSSEEAISIASALFGPTVTVSVVSPSATGLGTLDRKLAAIKTRDSTWHQELHFYTTTLSSR